MINGTTGDTGDTSSSVQTEKRTYTICSEEGCKSNLEPAIPVSRFVKRTKEILEYFRTQDITYGDVKSNNILMRDIVDSDYEMYKEKLLLMNDTNLPMANFM